MPAPRHHPPGGERAPRVTSPAGPMVWNHHWAGRAFGLRSGLLGLDEGERREHVVVVALAGGAGDVDRGHGAAGGVGLRRAAAVERAADAERDGRGRAGERGGGAVVVAAVGVLAGLLVAVGVVLGLDEDPRVHAPAPGRRRVGRERKVAAVDVVLAGEAERAGGLVTAGRTELGRLVLGPDGRADLDLADTERGGGRAGTVAGAAPAPGGVAGVAVAVVPRPVLQVVDGAGGPHAGVLVAVGLLNRGRVGRAGQARTAEGDGQSRGAGDRVLLQLAHVAVLFPFQVGDHPPTGHALPGVTSRGMVQAGRVARFRTRGIDLPALARGWHMGVRAALGARTTVRVGQPLRRAWQRRRSIPGAGTPVTVSLKKMPKLPLNGLAEH